ncbi:hypothetical protein SpCBS45565_g00582 [Spizellomyces sp. 'palustris']|nr:hypothetical protein SpCBS45565_g00582 [Spizellomyces sp. 'palustris']
MAKSFTVAEVAQHNKPDDCYLIIDGKVYDITDFQNDHPGGKKILLKVAGKDASEQFAQFHNKGSVMQMWGSKLYVGDIASAQPTKQAFPSATSQPPARQTKSSDPTVYRGQFGEQVPFGDPAWYQNWASPYYNESHRRLRAVMREFVDREIMPFCHEWDEAQNVPQSLFKRFAEVGILGAIIGCPWPTEYCPYPPPANISPEEWDPFHELVVTDELARVGSIGVLWAVVSGVRIGLPPILHFGSEELKRRVVPKVLGGEKRICLGITEPSAGSDVSGLLTEAVKSPDGTHYIVNGEKKWITNGVFADYFTVACRTGGKGHGGVSMIVVERTEGVTTKRMKCTGVWPSGTTYITFEDVKVPVANLIGKEHEGFKYTMYNFNHERLGICQNAVRFARVCLEESIKYGSKRRTFGKRLVDHPVIRAKLAHMARQIESTQRWVEDVTYQTKILPKEEQDKFLGGSIALLKAQCTVTFEFCVREAIQIFGGLGYTRGGQGEKIERLARDVKAYTIPGGSEEIMLDQGIKMALRQASKQGAKL